MKAAITLCGWRNIPCFAHTINLIVQSGVEKISAIKTKAKSTVEYFKKSTQAYNKFHNMQKQMNCKELNLKQEVPTRWNSSLYMFERLLEVKEPLISTLALTNPQLNNITEVEWNVISEACEVLRLFEEITVEMSSQKNVTISKVIILVKSMLKHVHDMKRKTNSPEINQMCEKMIEELNKRFKDVEGDDLTRESTILDPRLKKYGFKNDDFYDRAYRRVSQQAYGILITPLNPDPEETVEPVATTSKVWGDFDNSVKHVLNPNPTAAAIIETDKYISENLLPRTQNPLKWWEEKRFVYPRLYQLMKRRLCIPASSTPCERIFSKTGQILTDRRNRLKAKLVSQIMFLHVNM